MKMFKKQALASATIMALSLVSVPASAIVPVTDAAHIAVSTEGFAAVSGAVSSAAGTIGKAISAAVLSITGSDQTNTQNIINAIGSMSTRVEGQVKAGYESNVDMLKTFNDTMNNQNNYREQAKYMVERSSALRGAPCEDVSAVAAAAMGKAAKGAAGGGAALARDAVTKMTSSNSPQADAAKKTDIHDQKYCATGDKSCGSPVEADLQNADQTSASIFTGASADNKKVYLSFDEKRVQAAKDYTNNLYKPVASPRLDPVTEKTPQGKAYMALHRAETAKASLARKAADDLVASIDPKNAKMNGKPLGTILKELWQAQGFTSDTPVANEISFREMTEIEATRRYTSKKWYADIAASADQAQLLKEIAYMQALEINQRHQQIKQMENLLTLNSGIYHELVEMNMGPKLAAQRDAAIKSAR